MEVNTGELVKDFERRYSTTPRLFRAPGRVNVIGEHTDYNDGFVMPFAIDRDTVVAGASRLDTKLRVHAADLGESTEIDLKAPPVKRRGSWIDYVEGTARCVAESFGTISGADLLISSSVPIGGGLSSSAALEVSVGYALLRLNHLGIDGKTLAFAAQRAEHEFVGTRSGIMDQFTATFSRKGTAMLLDCRLLEIDHIELDDREASFVVIDTQVKHSLASSEYNTRRAECEAGVAVLRNLRPEIRALRDVTPDDLKAAAGRLSETIFKRCRHVVTENERTLQAGDALRNRDFVTAGELMSESHRSLRDDYEVSCPELDQLVDTALTVDGVFGARMTGGGFGGCTVTLVKKEEAEKLQAACKKAFASRFGHEPDVYTFRASSGASELTV